MTARFQSVLLMALYLGAASGCTHQSHTSTDVEASIGCIEPLFSSTKAYFVGMRVAKGQAVVTAFASSFADGDRNEMLALTALYSDGSKLPLTQEGEISMGLGL